MFDDRGNRGLMCGDDRSNGSAGMLELKEVSRRINGVDHLAGISMRIESGVMNVLLGPARAGKTSLMRAMAGLDRPGSGEIWFNGVNVTGTPVARRNVAMVYQQFINYPGWTVRENIASPLKVKRTPAAEIERDVQRVAELLRLTPYLDRKPLELSGGQQQRVAMARAIVKKAGLVLLDEPLANLDYKLREELRAELPKLFADSGAVVVYATTEPLEALLLGGMTATMSEGRVTQFGPSHQVYRAPADLITAETYSDPPLNVFPVAAAARPARFPGAATLGVRPHHVRLSPKSGEADAYSATVLSMETNGSETFVHLRVGDARWVMLTHGVHAFEIGSALTVHVESGDVMSFDSAGRALALTARAA
jgi:glycerol transport system ATP-binding protein